MKNAQIEVVKSNLRVLFETLQNQYPKGYNSDYIKDYYISVLMDINKTRKQSEITRIFVNACEYISTVQSQIAFHNLKNI